MRHHSFWAAESVSNARERMAARDANVPQIAVRHLRQLRATAGAAKPLGGEMLHSGHKK